MNYFKFTLIKNEDGIISYELRDKDDKLIRNEKNVESAEMRHVAGATRLSITILKEDSMTYT